MAAFVSECYYAQVRNLLAGTFFLLSTMKILNWNMLGAERHGFYSQVMDHICQYFPDILLYMETKVNFDRVLKIIKRILLSNSIEIPFVGFSGWIWLFWKDNVDFKLRFVKGHINDTRKNIYWLVIFVYNYPHQHLQTQLWKDISNLKFNLTDSLLIIGDLNKLSSSQEKLAKNKGIILAILTLGKF